MNWKGVSAESGKLIVVLRLRDRLDARRHGGVPEPAADVARYRLAHQPLLADAGDEHLHRHLALAKAGDLDARREVGGRVLDGVLEVVPGHGDGQANPVLGQLLDRRLHAAIQPERI